MRSAIAAVLACLIGFSVTACQHDTCDPNHAQCQEDSRGNYIPIIVPLIGQPNGLYRSGSGGQVNEPAPINRAPQVEEPEPHVNAPVIEEPVEPHVSVGVK